MTLYELKRMSCLSRDAPFALRGKDRLLTDLRAREFYEKPTRTQGKLAAAVKRHYKRLRSQTFLPSLLILALLFAAPALAQRLASI